jgi:CRISPR-associated protein Cmr4
MIKKEISSILSFYAISPIHAGSGASVASVDLPIQRERHTGFPHIQSSAVKGALRSHYRNFGEKGNKDVHLINYIFGSDEQDKWNKSNDSLPGAISVSDAKILAFPMRSNVAPFVWVTCPTILKRLKNDLEYINIELDLDYENLKLTDDEAKIISGEFKVTDNKIILEEAVVLVSGEFNVDFISNNFSKLDRLILISDDMFDYCVSSCTEIQTNIKIESETGTAKDGSLRYQEFLPSDSVLYSVVYFSAQDMEDLQAEAIKKHLTDTVKDFVQVGGDVTFGKGICKVNWIDGGE